MKVLVVDDEPDARAVLRCVLGDRRRGVRGRHRSFAAIALTAFARCEERARALRAGFLSMQLSKPAHSAELIASVASLAGRTDQRAP